MQKSTEVLHWSQYLEVREQHHQGDSSGKPSIEITSMDKHEANPPTQELVTGGAPPDWAPILQDKLAHASQQVEHREARVVCIGRILLPLPVAENEVPVHHCTNRTAERDLKKERGIIISVVI